MAWHKKEYKISSLSFKSLLKADIFCTYILNWIDRFFMPLISLSVSFSMLLTKKFRHRSYFTSTRWCYFRELVPTLQGQDTYRTYFSHLLLKNVYKFYMLNVLVKVTHIYKWSVLQKEYKLQNGSCKNKVYFQTQFLNPKETCFIYILLPSYLNTATQ